MRTTLLEYLHAYSQWQQDILLISRKSNDVGFGRKVLLNSLKFDYMEHYNHRNILDNEVVIEFDDVDPAKNGEAAGLVTKNIQMLNLPFSAWQSGNKSIHVHTHFDMKDVEDIKLMKRLLIEFLCTGVALKPDYQLAIRRHLIRAEFGLHEKTGKFKTLLAETNNYPTLAPIPLAVKARYTVMKTKPVVKSETKNISPEHPLVQKVLNNPDSIIDGRQQLLYRLVHILKQSYKIEDVTTTLVRWYIESGGKKYSTRRLVDLIKYHYDKDVTYSITERSFAQTLDDLGIK